MAWRGAARVGRVCGVALAVATVSVTAVSSLSAQSSDYERVLAGIRLNTSNKTVLARYGNPNEIIIGDVGIRQGPPQPGGGMGAPGMGGQMGMPGGGMGDMPGGGMGMGDPGGGMGGRGGPMGMPSPAGGGMSMGPNMGGGPSIPSMGGGPSMGGPMGMPAPGGMGGPMGMPSPGGMPGGEDFPGAGPGGMGMPGAPGGGVGQFGQTVSTLARQQEVTWIYNRKIKNNLVSYEFLIGPGGNVSQIRVSGYTGGDSRTKRGVSLGSTYKQVVALYGYPEEHYQVGRILVASYRNRNHVQFQFLNNRSLDPMSPGNKVVAITIATVE